MIRECQNCNKPVTISPQAHKWKYCTACKIIIRRERAVIRRKEKRDILNKYARERAQKIKSGLWVIRDKAGRPPTKSVINTCNAIMAACQRGSQ